MRLKLASISKTKWDSYQFLSLREQILISQRQILKGVNTGVERERFINACNTIQQLAFSNSQNIYTVESSLKIEDGMLNTPLLEKKNFKIIESLISSDATDIGGFIVLTDLFYGQLTTAIKRPTTKVKNKFPKAARFLNEEKFNSNPLTSKIQYALLEGEPIGSTYRLDRHFKLIAAIRDFVFINKNDFEKNDFEKNSFIRFAYEDGSIGDDFNLLNLEEITRPIPSQQLNVGLISNRHFELDSVIDYYLLRNTEISRNEDIFISDQEEISFGKSRNFFELLLNNLHEKKTIQVNLYHTGLESAIIGAYRAIVQLLSNPNYRGKIIIRPFVKKDRELIEWF